MVFDVQYEGNYTTVTAQIETATEGQLKLGKKDLWELGLDTTANIVARAIRVEKTVDETYPGEQDQNWPAPDSGEKGTRATIDANLFKPLLKGWKPEVVYRRDAKTCDIYYEAPIPEHSRNPIKRSSRKKRSTKDIIRHLEQHPDDDLQLSDFSYEKKPLGILCDQYEIVRNANEKTIILSDTLEYCPIHTGFTRGTCPVLNITRQKDGTMTWNHETTIPQAEADAKHQPGNKHRKMWNVNISTGEIAQDDPLRLTPRDRNDSIESTSGKSDEERDIEYTQNDENQTEMLESIKQECLSEEDATETFMEAYLKDRHHEDHGYTMAEDKQHGGARSVKGILQDCLRLLDDDDTEDEETHNGEGHE